MNLEDLWFKDPVYHVDPRYDRYYVATSKFKTNIYICNAEMASNVEFLKARHIRAIVRPMDSINPRIEGFLYYDDIDLADSKDGADLLESKGTYSVLEKGLSWMHKALRDVGNVLVHCELGQSRSPSFVSAYIMRYETGLSPDGVSADQVVGLVSRQILRRGSENDMLARLVAFYPTGEGRGRRRRGGAGAPPPSGAYYFWLMLQRYESFLRRRRGGSFGISEQLEAKLTLYSEEEDAEGGDSDSENVEWVY